MIADLLTNPALTHEQREEILLGRIAETEREREELRQQRDALAAALDEARKRLQEIAFYLPVLSSANPTPPDANGIFVLKHMAAEALDTCNRAQEEHDAEVEENMARLVVRMLVDILHGKTRLELTSELTSALQEHDAALVKAKVQPRSMGIILISDCACRGCSEMRALLGADSLTILVEHEAHAISGRRNRERPNFTKLARASP